MSSLIEPLIVRLPVGTKARITAVANLHDIKSSTLVRRYICNALALFEEENPHIITKQSSEISERSPVSSGNKARTA